MGFPGESYGNQLLRIELKPQAWIALFDGESLAVVDANDDPVPLEMALAHPERIGAIFYASPGDFERRYCGTFRQGAASFREYALGNIDMVARWSLATPDIAQRLKDDIVQLKLFESQLRCGTAEDVPDQGSWARRLACLWTARPSTDAPSDNALVNYEGALALRSDLYWPSPENVESIIAALEMSMPSGAPLDVKPGQ